ncbi:UDP-glucose 4-epimerase GalE [Roseomonas sp. E05]|uniref:UDP-glucose 4-epimerase GalE n=1 Tax=Roseomonas sp. E05 TaxID=3046310 RepID=UPI0024B98911|nr:UDP-glucose 4-epimerase GalE [Roseomonas sp. E05]MDJ0391469.1 UDP-glucose 4-epimerase GalE [Roseomonas sp. E05]
MSTYLVSGGAGYIGSHVAAALLDGGHRVVVVDNLQQGHAEAVPEGAEFVRADVGDAAAMDAVFASWGFQGVIHLAALSVVGDSMRDPLHYIAKNVGNTMTLARAAMRGGCSRFVLSSTAAVYGDPACAPITEDEPTAPASAYGASKLMAEQGLAWASELHGLRWASLRYFNAAGADPAGQRGEDHAPETHLIPLAIDAALGRRAPLTVFGDDYPTPDGTCLRDYVHVTDLADAHLRVLGLLAEGTGRSFNLGNGRGFSVKEVIGAVAEVTGCPVPHRLGVRRPGDPPALVAASDRLRAATGWRPRFGALHAMVETAYRWRLKNPEGYAGTRHVPPPPAQRDTAGALQLDSAELSG